jgi:hypothetical protein
LPFGCSAQQSYQCLVISLNNKEKNLLKENINIYDKNGSGPFDPKAHAIQFEIIFSNDNTLSSGKHCL